MYRKIMTVLLALGFLGLTGFIASTTPALGQDKATAKYLLDVTNLSLRLNYQVLVGIYQISAIICSQNYTKRCDAVLSHKGLSETLRDLSIAVNTLKRPLPQVGSVATPEQKRAIDEANCKIAAIKLTRPGNTRSFIGSMMRQSEADTLAELCMKSKGYKINPNDIRSEQKEENYIP